MTSGCTPEAGPAGLAAQLGKLRGVTVLDATPKMLLVQGPRSTLDRAVSAHAGWELTPETFTPRPEPQPNLPRVAPRAARATRVRRAAG